MSHKNEAVEAGKEAYRVLIDAWGRGEANADSEDIARAILTAAAPIIRADERRRVAAELREYAHDWRQPIDEAIYAAANHIAERNGK